MMGPKTLGAIKKGLRVALGKTGKDPIQWLEDRIQLLQKTEKPDEDEIDLLRQLGRVLDDAGKAKPNPRPPRTKARR